MLLTKAIIPAGGLGTRFLPATKTTPKEMLPLLEKPAIQYIVEEGVKSNIKTFVVDDKAIGMGVNTPEQLAQAEEEMFKRKD